MEIISSKWFIGLVIVVLVFLILLGTGRKSVVAEVVIKGPKEDVWKTLTDFSTVKDWNKVLIPIAGVLEEGHKITYEFTQDEGGKSTTMDAIVKKIEVGQLINQRGGIVGILTFDHQYLLSQTGNTTTVKIKEKYRGVMVNFWNPDPVEKAYERLLMALKKQVENHKP